MQAFYIHCRYYVLQNLCFVNTTFTKISLFFHQTTTYFSCFFSPTDRMKDHNHLHSNGSLEEKVKSVWESMDKRLPRMQQSTSKNQSSGSRRKRFLSYPRFVELMVTADAKMVRHHGGNLEHYILTIMSVVSKMFFQTIFYLSKQYFSLISGLLEWSNTF